MRIKKRIIRKGIKFTRMKNKKDGILHIRINKELLEELKKQADKENRNLTNLIETIIKNYLNERINNMK